MALTTGSSLGQRPGPRNAGRGLVPFVIAVLMAGFLAIVIYQAAQTTDTPESPWAATTPNAAASTTNNTPAKPLPDNNATPATPVAVAGQTVRETLAAFFKRMPPDAMVLDLAGKLDLVRAREELQAYLDSLGPEEVESLIEVLGDEVDFGNRRFLMYALGRIGTDRAVDGLVGHYHKMAALGTKDSEALHTIRALGTSDTPHSFDQLMDLAVDSGDPQHRHRVLEQLGNHHLRAEGIPVYQRLLIDDGRMNVRSYAAQALKKTADATTAPSIEQALLTEKNRYVRQSMIGALGGIGDVNSIRALEEVTNTDDDHVSRMSAVNSLRMIGGPLAESVLEKVAENDANQRVREDAQRALQQLREQGG
ncbi:MAG: HEAT repeat domain-containing protein [Planctomycetota bacterium]